MLAAPPLADSPGPLARGSFFLQTPPPARPTHPRRPISIPSETLAPFSRKLAYKSPRISSHASFSLFSWRATLTQRIPRRASAVLRASPPELVTVGELYTSSSLLSPSPPSGAPAHAFSHLVLERNHEADALPKRSPLQPPLRVSPGNDRRRRPHSRARLVLLKPVVPSPMSETSCKIARVTYLAASPVLLVRNLTWPGELPPPFNTVRPI
jgi:hypothetical protein